MFIRANFDTPTGLTRARYSDNPRGASLDTQLGPELLLRINEDHQVADGSAPATPAKKATPGKPYAPLLVATI
jgi:hypothetical protein